jgi:hypothetical protein
MYRRGEARLAPTRYRVPGPARYLVAAKHFTAILFQAVWVYSEMSRGGGHG